MMHGISGDVFLPVLIEKTGKWCYYVYIDQGQGGIIMLAAVKGYYDGNQIVVNEADRKNLSVGDEVIITILDKASKQKTEARAEKRRRLIDSDAFVIPTGRTTKEIDEYIKEMRSDDRF